MGCDIHFYVERFNNGKWVVAQCPKELLPAWDNKRRSSWYVQRNYLLFGILAGVRWTDVEPPFLPRDIPPDTSILIKKEFDRWEGDAHTPHHIYLNELLSFETTLTKQDMYLDIKNYKSFKNKEFDLAGALYDPYDETIISIEEMEKLIKLAGFANNENDLKKVVKITEEVPISSFIRNFFNVHVEEMKKLHKDHSKVRCVFWFDN